jgi:hypothetical protein
MRQVEVHRDASDRFCCEAPKVSRGDYAELCNAISERFQLVSTGPEVSGLETVFREYRGRDGMIGLEWDIWSGFIVVAKDVATEPLVREISAFLRGDNRDKKVD